MPKVLLDNLELSACAMVKLGVSKKGFDLWGYGHYSIMTMIVLTKP